MSTIPSVSVEISPSGPVYPAVLQALGAYLQAIASAGSDTIMRTNIGGISVTIRPQVPCGRCKALRNMADAYDRQNGWPSSSGLCASCEEADRLVYFQRVVAR